MTAENDSLVSAEIAGRKVRRKNFIRRAILGVLFFFGVIFCSITAAGLLASSFLVENILSLFGFVLAAVLLVLFERWLVYREKKTNSRHNVLLPVLLIIAVFVATFTMMAHQLGKFSSAIVPGKNINASGYGHDFTDFGSNDLEKLIQETCGESEGIQVAQIDLKDYHEVFFHADDEIISYEFVEQNDRYFYIGTRKLAYGADFYPIDSYSWQETVFADASMSRISHGIRFFKDGDSDPAWGVTAFNPEKAVQIKGRYPDQVIELKTDSGSTIYLWIYNNLNNTAELKLEDVNVLSE